MDDFALDTLGNAANRDVPLARGDVVAFDAGVIVGGYAGELGRTHVVGGDALVDPEHCERWSELWDRLLAECQPGAPLSSLLAAYDTAGLPAPPMPVARGLGLGFDLPLVTHALPGEAAGQAVEAGMVLVLTAYLWTEGVGALYGADPVVVTANGPEALTSTPLRSGRSS